MENKFNTHWVCLDDGYDENPELEDYVEVVEFAALQACEARLESANAENEKLKKSLEIVVEVLKQAHCDADYMDRKDIESALKQISEILEAK